MVDGDVNVREVRTFRQETRLPNSPHGPYISKARVSQGNRDLVQCTECCRGMRYRQKGSAGP